MKKALRKENTFVTFTLAILIVFAGLFTSYLLYKRSLQFQHDELLRETKFLVSAINLDRIRTILTPEEDVQNYTATRLKKQLASLKLAHEHWERIYIQYRTKNGDLRYIGDSPSTNKRTIKELKT